MADESASKKARLGLPVGIINTPCRVSIKVDVKDAQYEWFSSPWANALVLQSRSPEFEISSGCDGLYFGHCQYGEQQITSELFEVDLNRSGPKELDEWPHLPRGLGVGGTRTHTPTPSEIFKATEKAQSFLDYSVSTEVPAAVFSEGIISFCNPPEDELAASAAGSLVAAFSTNNIHDYCKVFARMLKLHKFLGNSEPFVVPDFSVHSQSKQNDSMLNKFTADLAIAISVKGMAVPLVVFEHKSQPAKKTQQLCQGLSYFQFFANSPLNLIPTARFPCLLVNLAPTNLAVYGMLHTGGKLVYSDLYSASTKGDAAETSATKFLTGLLAFLSETLRFFSAGQIYNAMTPLYPVVNCCGPATSITYTKVLSSKVFEATAVFKDRSDDPVSVVIKVLKRPYPLTFHSICAAKGYAPKILAFEEGACYTMLVMEKVEGITLDEFLKSNPASERAKEVADALEKALSFFHRHNYVHGDFRGPNIVISDDGSVKILDLDWSCVENVDAKYLILLNNHLRWPCKKDEQKLKVHDLYFLAGHKARLGKIIRQSAH